MREKRYKILKLHYALPLGAFAVAWQVWKKSRVNEWLLYALSYLKYSHAISDIAAGLLSEKLKHIYFRMNIFSKAIGDNGIIY